MDELEISGKRYISSKRIARENKYHSDYIGQLIRGGKIVGTKVGRAWYVDEESFASYLSKENKTYVAPTVTPAEVPSPVVVVPTEVASEPLPIQKQEEVHEVPAPVAQEKIVVHDQPRRIEIRKTNLTYVPDSSPLFPEITKRSSDIHRPSLQHAAPAQVANVAAAPEQEAPTERPKKKKVVSVIKGTSLFVVGIGVLGFIFFLSLGIDSTVSVEKGKPASVAFSQEKTFCFISGNCQNNSQATQ